jgi:hypothetical protein
VQLHRSRYRGVFEKVRRRLFAKRPYRCWSCDWRGWLKPPPASHVQGMAAWARLVDPPDLDKIEAAVRDPEPARPEART